MDYGKLDNYLININNTIYTLPVSQVFSINDFYNWTKHIKNQFKFPGGIYIIENTKSRKVYIGSTISFKRRLSFHINKLRSGGHINNKLQNSFSKNEEEVFNIRIYPLNLSRKELFDIEAFLIETFDTFKSGYNKVIDSRCAEWSEEQKRLIGKRLSIANKGIPKTKEHKEKCGRAISIANSGEGNPRAILTKDDILNIRKDIIYLSIKELSEKYHIAKQTVRNIIHLRCWNYPDCIPENYSIPKITQSNRRFSEKDISYIRANLSNLSIRELAELYNVDRHLISHIIHNKTYKND